MNQGGWSGGPGQPGGPPQGYAPQGQPQQGPPGQQQPGQQQPGQQQPGQPQQGYAQAPQGYAQPQQGYAQAQPAFAPPAFSPTAVESNAAKGFFLGLVDFSFTTFIATKVIKVVYGLLLIGIVLGMLGAAWTAFDYTFLRSNFHPEGFVQLFMVPVAGAGAVVVARLYCELLVVMFQIANNLADINRKTKE